MESFTRDVQVRWSDLDPNTHLRHSVYYDWGALSRIDFMVLLGLTPGRMQEAGLGPVLFREECVFRKEIHLGDRVTIDLELLKARKDLSRWSIRHSIYKNEKELAAVITVDGAWIDTTKRKLASPPGVVVDVFMQMPKAADFQWLD